MQFLTPRGRELNELCIDSTPDGSGIGKKVAFRCKYNPGDKHTTLSCSPSIKIVSQKDNKHGTIDFVIEVLALNVAERVAYVMAQYDTSAFGSDYRADETLRLKIGRVQKHTNFESDLLAQMLGMSSDADHLLAYYRILSAKNNLELPRDDWNDLKDNPLKQNTGPDPRKWNCGAALATFGSRYAEHHYTSGGRLYYRTPSPSKLSEVKFKADVVRDGAQKIRTRLKNGNFVQVFVGHHEHLTVSSDGVIQPSGNTHYITLFGASQDGKEFLYFDPWPQGSMMTYQSGIMGSVHLIFAGIITCFEDEGKIRTRDSAPGLHKYVILTGP